MYSVNHSLNHFLAGVCLIYFIAFCSLYHQVPGLYGDNGILPARKVFQKKTTSSLQSFFSSGNLLHFTEGLLGLKNVSHGMELICLLGMGLSVIGFCSRKARIFWLFFPLYLCYYSVFQVGQLFLHFQWDILLLEVGFLCIFVAPLLPRRLDQPRDGITFWLVKWLLFRLMFASGVVKLTSSCPTWWGLTALHWHYESQCIPLPTAWFVQQLPGWFDSLSVAATLIIEIPLPFLFFSPWRRHRLFAGYAQVLLMVLISFTGNYNFFTILTTVLCFALSDNRHLGFGNGSPNESKIVKWLWPLALVIDVILISQCIRYFGIAPNFDPFQIDSKITFTRADLDTFLSYAVPASIFIGVLALTWELISAIYGSLFVLKGGVFKKAKSLIASTIYGAVAIGLFSVSLVPYTQGVYPGSSPLIPPEITAIYRKVQHFEVANSYGLFRRMTGVGGRPEVVLEASNTSSAGDWKEIPFLYKVNGVDEAPPICAPHQPRIDWQLWFASLGSYEHNAWLVNLVYRLLQGKAEVFRQIDLERAPFSIEKPPKYIRVQLYHYHYTKPTPEKMPYNWWWRELKSEYMPVMHLEEPNMKEYISQSRLDVVAPKRTAGKDAEGNNFWETLILVARNFTDNLPPHVFVYASMLGLFAIKITKSVFLF